MKALQLVSGPATVRGPLQCLNSVQGTERIFGSIGYSLMENEDEAHISRKQTYMQSQHCFCFMPKMYQIVL